MAKHKTPESTTNSKAKKGAAPKTKHSSLKNKNNSFFDSVIDSIVDIFQPHIHHEEAAKHLTEAAQHHKEAHKAQNEGHHGKAAIHAQAARGHIAFARSHATKADKKSITPLVAQKVKPIVDGTKEAARPQTTHTKVAAKHMSSAPKTGIAAKTKK